MHLAYVTTGYPYVSHTFIQNEVLGLRALGHRVDTYAKSRAPISECRSVADREAWETTETLLPVKVRDYVSAHLRGIRNRPRGYRAALRSAVSLAGGAPRDIARHMSYFLQAGLLAEKVIGTGADHLHAHFANVSSDLAMLASIMSEGAFDWSFTLHGPTEFFDVRHFRLREKAQAARFVVCISEFARSQLMAHADLGDWPKFHVVRCGVDTARFQPSARQAGEEAETNDSSLSTIHVACVGRLVPEKGQGLLISAARTLIEAGTDLYVSFVGDGPAREALERLAETTDLDGRFRFLGSQPPSEVIRVLDASDVFCLPSFAEGIPVVLMEAMAMGIPPVTSRIAGIPELIENGVSGRMVTPGSVAELTEALGELVASAGERQRIAEAARERVLSDFSLDDNITELSVLFEHLVMGSHR